MQPESLDLSALGASIRRRRETMGLNVHRLSQKAEMGYGYLRRVESGSANVGLEVVARLANALRTPIDDLLRDAGLNVSSASSVPELDTLYRDLDQPMRRAFVKIGAILLEAQSEYVTSLDTSRMAAYPHDELEEHVRRENEDEPA